MIYFVRHACRADNGPIQEIKQIKNISDPHITKVGVYQSFMLGERFSFQIPDIYEKEILIVSSPYLRCLKTTESIINGLKQKYINLVGNQVYIEDALMEHQSHKYFPENHFETLACFNSKVIVQKTAYNSLGMFKDFRQKELGFPESGKQLLERFLKILTILEGFAQDPANKNVVLILVGHGFFVSYLYAHMKKETVFDYPYLSTSKLYFNTETNKMQVELLDEVLY